MNVADILEILNSQNHDKIDQTLKKVRKWFRYSEPIQYDYRETAYHWSDHYITSIRISGKLEYNSTEWHDALFLLKEMADYPAAKDRIIRTVIDIKNLTIWEYNPNFHNVRYSIDYGE